MKLEDLSRVYRGKENMQFAKLRLGVKDEDRSQDPNYKMQSSKQRAKSGENAVSIWKCSSPKRTYFIPKDLSITKPTGVRRKRTLKSISKLST